MTAADDADLAYRAAQFEIACVAATGATKLRLDGATAHGLTALPPEIGALSSLQELRLEKTRIVDLSPLATLAALRGLWVVDTPVVDLSPLSGLTTLQRLHISATQVRDLHPLADLSSLESLFLYDTEVADLAVVGRLPHLRVLCARKCRVTDLAPLSQTSGLRSLDIRHTQVADLRPCLSHPDLGTGVLGGLWFANTRATRRDPRLAALATVPDRYERTARTCAYLRSLPPWPEPLSMLGGADDGLKP